MAKAKQHGLKVERPKNSLTIEFEVKKGEPMKYQISGNFPATEEQILFVLDVVVRSMKERLEKTEKDENS